MNRLRALLLASPLSLLPAQELVWEQRGNPQFGIGGTVLPIGDHDGDGHGDLFTGFGLRDPNNIFSFLYGGLIILSGSTRQILFASQQLPRGWSPLQVVPAGDMDGDGKNDWFETIAFSAGVYPIEVRCMSTRTGLVLWRIQAPGTVPYAHQILGDLDLDGDGRGDLIVATDRTSQSVGRFEAYDHFGGPLYTLPLPPGTNLPAPGRSMGKVGDVDGDGCDDFAYGRYGPTSEGFVVLVSGRTGATIRTVQGSAPGQNLGFEVQGVGDMTGDGIPEYAATNFAGTALLLFSGADGSVLFSRTGAGTGSYLLGGPHDVDLDGVPDLVWAHPGLNPNLPFGPIRAVSGRDFSLLWEFYSDTRIGITELGRTMAWLGPLPGSPYPVFVFDEPGYPTIGSQGRIGFVRTNLPGAAAQHGAACSSNGRLPDIALRPSPAGLRLHAWHDRPGALAVLVAGTSRSSWQGVPLPLALDPLGFPGCALGVAPEIVAATISTAAQPFAGYARKDFAGAPAAAGGTTLYAQWLILDANGHAATAVQELQLQ